MPYLRLVFQPAPGLCREAQPLSSRNRDCLLVELSGMMAPQKRDPAAVSAENGVNVRASMPRLRNLLRHRMAYGQVIPPDARVSPDEFSEDEFPVYCPSCDYPLRGLQGHYCPECGREFERGRLLVEQYVIEQGKRNCRRTSKYARWTSLLGLGLFGLLAVGVWYQESRWLNAAKSGVMPNPLHDFMWRVFLPVGVAAAVLTLVSTILFIRLAVVGGAQGKRVFAAIDKERSTYKKAQQRRWILWVVWLAAMVGFFTWDLREDARGWASYYWSKPARALLPLGIAAAIGLILYFIVRIWNRKNRSEDGVR